VGGGQNPGLVDERRPAEVGRGAGTTRLLEGDHERVAAGCRGPAADELRRAKSQVQSGFVFSLETTQGLGEAIGRSWILTGSPGAFLRDFDELVKVSAADIQRVVKQYLSNDHATVVVIPPKAR
jgi:predicted Zn-dependent peptidase